MARIDVEDHRADRGKHLVDLLADGTGQPAHRPIAPFEQATAVPRAPWLIGGASVVLLVIALVTVLVR